jgi:predicted amidohydrolase
MRTHRRTRERHAGQFIAVLAALGAWLGGLAADAPRAAEIPPRQAGSTALPRRDRPPRKVLLGTVVSGYEIFKMPLDRRLQRMDELADAVAAEARSSFPGKRLDLVILPESFLARPGDVMPQEAVRLEEVQPRIAACASRLGSYMVVPLLMQEAGEPVRYSNAAVLADRAGRVVGIYRKVHPVAAQGSDVLEGGTTPGRDFPVFDCDFGRVGMQICFDMLYPDGWQALASQGAEIVALASASPETVHPCLYALQHSYYIVSATPRDHSAVYSPLGLIEAQVTKPGVLVHEIDLSYALVHWEAVLENGEALRRKFGDRVGFHYYDPEDNGIFWSNDPETPIGQMLGSLNLSETDESVQRIRMLEDKARGGPPAMP